jgi:hypothetical protein
MNYRKEHYCDRFDCLHPPKLACNQFCTSCSRTIGPHRTTELKSEFVQVTKKELALQERLPPRSKLNLTYGYLPSRGQSTPDDDWSKPSHTWPTPAPKKNDCQPVLGYYKYTLVEYPGESSGSWRKLFWLMIIGVIIWFWFFR